MPRVNALVLRTAGTNCDRETLVALRLAGAAADSVHIERLKERPGLLAGCDLLAVPGGFSYGDDLGAGRILGNELRFFLADALRALVDRGGLVIGICNGFQALVQAGLLPDPGLAEPEATLGGNTSGRFGTRWVHLAVGTDRSPWLRAGERLELPVAHAEGRFVARDASVIERLAGAGQVALRYAAADGGGPAAGFPENPSGSAGDVAGVCDPTGRVLGLMPHPERYAAFHHHPLWTRRPSGAPASPDGLRLFRNAVEHLASA